MNNKELVRLELHISGVGYLEENFSYFTKLSLEHNNKIEVDAKELKPISHFKEEKQIKK